jgi:hypothetical protein
MNTDFAIILWVLMLWPLIVGIAYPILRKPGVPTVTAFAFASVVVGYGAMAGALMFMDAIEKWNGGLGVLGVALPLLAPLLSTHLIFQGAKATNDQAQ